MTTPSFYKQFRAELKITPQNNDFEVLTYNPAYDFECKQTLPIFAEDVDGNVDILIYTLDRKLIEVKHPKADLTKDVIYNTRSQFLHTKRLKEPKTWTDPKTGEKKEMKYQIPKGAEMFPFFPPLLVRKYEEKAEIDTLFLTEGAKKAWYASLFDVPVVGLGSITLYKEKETKAMYEDVIKLIRTCKVKNVVMLYDGDCFDISLKALNEGKDLYTRPSAFFNSASNIRELFKDYEVDVYFGCVNSDVIESKPKGLDDVFLAMPGNENILVEDLLTFSKKTTYFTKVNITNSTNKLAQKFCFEVHSFYRKYEEIIGNKKFVFRGTKYYFSEDKQQLEIEIPAEAKDYFRVGDDYYKIIHIPNKYKQLERQYHRRNNGTIKQDHGSDIFKHIQKFEAFCNVPSHNDFAQVINNCFNLYYQIEHLPEEGDCSTTLDFIRHIFGKQFELGLDYIQLLYHNPTQILPILCLVSKENKTGKSTFIKWLKNIFGQNATIIGNEQLNNNFNSSWGSKLLICCEESFVEKIATVEKIKALSTGDKIQMEMKGRDAVEIDFFGKFILASNKEEQFIYASREDIRYWVIKVPTIAVENVRLMYELIDEIPAFLNFLNNRKLSTQNESRMHFKESLLHTEALEKLREANKPKLERQIVEAVKELFLETGLKTLHLPISYIQIQLLKSPNLDVIYLRKILEDYIGVDRYKNSKGKYDMFVSNIPYFNGTEVVFNSQRCRPYIFERDKFLTAGDLMQYAITETDPEPPEFEF